jgi:hypothetical protein
MYQFIPRLPTKEAWATRLFQTRFTSVKAIVDAMEERHDLRFHFRGQLNFKDDSLVPHVFSGTNELECLLEKMDWNVSTIKSIYLYNYGYFNMG